MFDQVVKVHVPRVKVRFAGSNPDRTIIHFPKVIKGNFVISRTTKVSLSHLIHSNRFLKNTHKIIITLNHSPRYKSAGFSNDQELNLCNNGLFSGVILDQHTELYKDSEYEENNTCFLIVLTTNRGIVKLDMMDDYKLYKMWATTIDHILALSTSFTKYELKFYKS